MTVATFRNLSADPQTTIDGRTALPGDTIVGTVAQADGSPVHWPEALWECVDGVNPPFSTEDPDLPGEHVPLAAPEPVAEDVPAGTVDEIVSWVAGDVQRARQALEVELAMPTPRSTLTVQLDAIITAAE